MAVIVALAAAVTVAALVSGNDAVAVITPVNELGGHGHGNCSRVLSVRS